jgi:hypothetical protein
MKGLRGAAGIPAKADADAIEALLALAASGAVMAVDRAPAISWIA